MSKAVQGKFGGETAAYFQLLNAVNFHILFWSSRFLPNIFAFALSNFALAYWIAQKTSRKTDENSVSVYQNLYLTIMVSTAALFRYQSYFLSIRSELVILYGPIILLEIFYHKSLRLPSAFTTCYQALSRAIILTVLVDSWFWQKAFFWPEFKVFMFNVLENKSSAWGTSPYHEYFTALLPRIAPIAYPLGLLGVYFVKETRRYMIPALLFVIMYSALPHKEWRYLNFA